MVNFSDSPMLSKLIWSRWENEEEKKMGGGGNQSQKPVIEGVTHRDRQSSLLTKESNYCKLHPTD